MAPEMELCFLDLRYEGHRMKNAVAEGRLLASIAQWGIQEPLEGVDLDEVCVLLNGFKRYRCAAKLKIHTVPYVSLGTDEVVGILKLLRASNDRALGLLEQARFVEELKGVRRMSVAEIAEQLSVSKGWVSMRLGLIAQMTPRIGEQLLEGSFPVYSYMYTLRHFMRMNGVKKEEVEQFVLATSGKKLSARQIEQLAHGFFRGPDSFRQQILAGNLALPLQQMNQVPADPEGCSECERILLKDLEIAQKYMLRVMGKSQDPRLKSRPFLAQAHLLCGGILSRNNAFIDSLRKLHDRSGKA